MLHTYVQGYPNTQLTLKCLCTRRLCPRGENAKAKSHNRLLDIFNNVYSTSLTRMNSVHFTPGIRSQHKRYMEYTFVSVYWITKYNKQMGRHFYYAHMHYHCDAEVNQMRFSFEPQQNWLCLKCNRRRRRCGRDRNPELKFSKAQGRRVMCAFIVTSAIHSTWWNVTAFLHKSARELHTCKIKDNTTT